jgi:hypothetical protein
MPCRSSRRDIILGSPRYARGARNVLSSNSHCSDLSVLVRVQRIYLNEIRCGQILSDEVLANVRQGRPPGQPVVLGRIAPRPSIPQIGGRGRGMPIQDFGSSF